MQKYTNSVADFAGRPVANASVTVTVNSTGALATIYSDNGVTIAANPLSTDGNGEFSFYAADGRYNIAISGSGVTAASITDIQLNDYTDDLASDIYFTQAGTDAVSRSVQGKLEDFVSSKDFGAVGDGVTDDLAALQNFESASEKLKFIQSGDYNISANWVPSANDSFITSAADVKFSTNQVDYTNLIPYQYTPVFSNLLISRTYEDADWSLYGNVFQIASYVKSNSSGGAFVGVFGEGNAAVSGARVWGGNFVGYANASGAAAIGVEINCGVLTAGGSAYGLVIASAGSAGQPNNAIQIQSNDVNAQFLNGMRFNFQAVTGLLTGSVIYITGASTNTCERYIYASNVRATTAEIDLPSLLVGASPSTPANRIAIYGSNAGAGVVLGSSGSDTNIPITIQSKNTGVIAFQANGKNQFRCAANSGDDYLIAGAGTGGGVLSVTGSSTNADVVLTGKGTGGARIQGGDGVNKFEINTTGIGFYNTSPIAKPTATGSRASNAALASLLTALSNLGLITDSTSA